MTLINILDFPGTADAFNKPELYDWMRDMEGHAKLKQKHASVVAEQTKLMGKLRDIDNATLTAVGEDEAAKIEAELQKQDLHLARIKNEMVEAEARIMTFEPTDAHDTQVLLRFIASVLEFGNKIDVDYLADLLTGCSDVVASADQSAKTDREPFANHA